MKINPDCVCQGVIDQVDYINDDFKDKYDTNCYCQHTSPPCSACMHEGNPNNDHDPCEKCYLNDEEE